MSPVSLLLTDFEMTSLTQGVVRWAHILSGITWIGLLYFFNLVNVPTQGKLDGPTKKAVNPELLPRALWWFRWGAMSTIVFGLALFYMKYMTHEAGSKNGNMYAGEVLSDRAKWIMLGMTLGLAMWFNVWFIIWPAQRTIIRATKEGQKPPEGLPETAKRFSRINFILSGPMLVGMVAANNGMLFTTPTLAISLVVSLLAVHALLSAGPKVGTSI